MRTVRHSFATTTEANLFISGVEWVNADDVTIIDIEVGDRAVVVTQDDDDGSEGDALITYDASGIPDYGVRA